MLTTTILTTFFLLLLTSTMHQIITSSSTTENLVKVRVYVDKSGAENWYNIREIRDNMSLFWELSNAFSDINRMLKTLNVYDVNIATELAEVIILNDNILKADSENKIKDDQSLREFEQWITPSYEDNMYDMAILLTGHNLLDEELTDRACGYAYIGHVCSATGLAVVELTGNYFDVLCITHEIGHILGASHDGSIFAPTCKNDSGDAMNADIPFTYEGLTFSSCSATGIQNTISLLSFYNQNCMFERNDTGVIADPGSPDEVCRFLQGNESAMVRLNYSSYGDKLCSNLACLTSVDDESFSWKNYNTMDGMKCGKMKRCLKGQCLWMSSGDPDMSDNCPYDDQPWLGGQWQTTCEAYVRDHGCPTDGWKYTCCGSCTRQS